MWLNGSLFNTNTRPCSLHTCARLFKHIYLYNWYSYQFVSVRIIMANDFTYNYNIHESTSMLKPYHRNRTRVMSMSTTDMCILLLCVRIDSNIILSQPLSHQYCIVHSLSLAEHTPWHCRRYFFFIYLFTHGKKRSSHFLLFCPTKNNISSFCFFALLFNHFNSSIKFSCVRM